MAAPPPGVPPAYAPPYGAQTMPAYGYGGSPWAYERTKQIDRTKTGIFLLLIGTLLSWVPFPIDLIGYILLLVGAILVILGRKAFGETHSRNVIISIVLFFVGILVAITIAVIVALSNFSSFITGGGPTPAALASAINAILIGGIVGAAIIGIAEVLFTYGLQAQTGRILLWAAYGANVALSVAIYAIISPLLGGIVTQSDYNNLFGQRATLQLLNVIPAALFAGADYLAWSRISRSEIPAPPAAPTMAPTAPPFWNPPSPPMPPTSPPPSGPAPPINPQ